MTNESPAKAAERDARSRSLRTLGQTAIGAVPAGLLLIVGETLTDALSTGETVTVEGLTMALVPPVAAYLWRRLEGSVLRGEHAAEEWCGTWLWERGREAPTLLRCSAAPTPPCCGTSISLRRAPTSWMGLC